MRCALLSRVVSLLSRVVSSLSCGCPLSSVLTRARPNIGGLALAGSGVAVCIVWLLWLDFGGGVRGGG